MIINDKEAEARLNSPINLINQIRNGNGNKRNGAMNLFCLRQNNSSAEPASQGLSVKEAEVIKSPSGTLSKETLPKETLPKAEPIFNPFQKSELGIVRAVPTTPQISAPANEVTEPNLDNLLNDSEHQIKLSLAHDSALNLLTNSVALLATKLDDVKADRLPAVISAASKTVESIRRERLEQSKQGKDKEVHYHFYTPTQKKVSDYEVIEVS